MGVNVVSQMPLFIIKVMNEVPQANTFQTAHVNAINIFFFCFSIANRWFIRIRYGNPISIYMLIAFHLTAQLFVVVCLNIPLVCYPWLDFIFFSYLSTKTESIDLNECDTIIYFVWLWPEIAFKLSILNCITAFASIYISTISFSSLPTMRLTSTMKRNPERILDESFACYSIALYHNRGTFNQINYERIPLI